MVYKSPILGIFHNFWGLSVSKSTATSHVNKNKLTKSNFQKVPAQPNYSSTTNTFPRRYRRSHRVGLPDLDETVDAKDQEGSCDHQDKAFNLKLSSFVQCWKCEFTNSNPYFAKIIFDFMFCFQRSNVSSSSVQSFIQC